MTQALWQLDQVNMANRLTNLSLRIAPGVTAILGTSGVGKTSLLNLLVDFEKASSGSIIFNTPQTTAKQLPVFWVPQDDGLWPHMTAMQHLLAMADQRTAQHWLATLDLTNHAHKKPPQLSRGQQNRLAIARAMVSNASVLIMDEPLAHVAHQDAMRYWQIIIDHLKTQKQSLVFATHQPSRVLAYADHVLCLEEGKLLEQGPTQVLYQQPQHENAAYLLGPANWFSLEESKRYLTQTVTHPQCIRPEQLQITVHQESDLTIYRTQFHGSIQCSTLTRTDTDTNTHTTSKDIWHLPLPQLKVSDRVMLNVLSLILLTVTVFLTACNPSDNTPKIPVKNMNVWAVPVDGISVPAPRNAQMLKDGRMAVLDTAGRILLYNSTGKVTETWHLPTNKNGNAEGACLLRDGRVAVADTHYHRIVFFNMQGTITQIFGERGENPSQFIYPVSITQDDEGFIYVVEYGGNDRVQKFTAICNTS
ncbi:MAG: ATP-binding cassette domain-containing protein [Phycisphaeraceae bacterium]|nr:ATP-binding cassette domain-containing protein [Phycisphaeraceae bacterium]